MIETRLFPAFRWHSARFLVIALVALAALAVSACGDDDDDGGGGAKAGGSEKETTLSVREILPGELTGSLYDQVQHDSIAAAAEQVGQGRITFEPIFRVPYSERLTQTVLQAFQQGADLVIDNNVAGELFFNACNQVPDKKCLGYSEPLTEPAEPPAPNLRGVYVDASPMYYAEGVAAGRMTKSGTLGFVTPFKLPEFTSSVNAFALGCRSVRPDCTVRNVYINSFFDPPKTIEAVNSLIDSGADVIGHLMDDASPLVTAQKRGAHSFGLYKDQSESAPEAVITSLLYQPALESIYADELKLALDGGEWKPSGEINYGPKPVPNLEFSDFGAEVPADVQDEVEKVVQSIADGENPFVGPIKDAKGKVRIPDGEEVDMRGPFMYGEWTWPVEGVTGL